MAAESELNGGWNYFSYFTEIEEHFQRVRGTGLFLLSPLDWALIETWKNSGIPLEAALRGIESAFEKRAARRTPSRSVNSVAYCSQAVHAEAEAMARGGVLRRNEPVKAPFSLEELQAYLSANAERVRRHSDLFPEIAASLEKLAGESEQHYADLEQLEQRLTVLEEKMSAIARASQTEESLLEARRRLDASLRPYRGKMSAEQLTMLEKQFLERSLLEDANLPRLSLFYMVR